MTYLTTGRSEYDGLLGGILRTLRASLHSCPEAANQEKTTALIIESFLRPYKPDQILTGLGGHGVAAVFDSGEEGPTVLLRAELDALCVEDCDARGQLVRFADHRCGHDAHMTMVAGVAPLLAAERPQRGRAVLLFQPAEETGEGAARILDDPQFQQILPDAAIALHNLPGFPIRRIVAKAGTFCSASVGMRMVFGGCAAHAGEPEKARSPGPVIARLIESVPSLADTGQHGRVATVTYAILGRESFGTTPGSGELRITLRARSSEELNRLCNEVEHEARDLANEHRLSLDVEWLEGFPDTRNDPDLVERLLEVCDEGDQDRITIDEPFRWSEDFGHFGRICPIVFYGLGIGEDAAGLHSTSYGFPDECLDVGVLTHHRLLRRLLEQQTAIPSTQGRSEPQTRSDLTHLSGALV